MLSRMNIRKYFSIHHCMLHNTNYKVYFTGCLYFAGGKIPDAAMIHAARKKRQQAREMGDFIPVEETVAK